MIFYDIIVGRNIRALRQERQFPQSVIAEALQLHREAVSNIESGRRKISARELHLLSLLFGVSLTRIAPLPGVANVARITKILQRTLNL